MWLNRKPTLPSRKWCDKKGQTQKSNCHLAGLFLCLKMGLNRDSMPRALSLHSRTISDYQVSQVKSLLRAPHQIKQLTFPPFFISRRHHFFTKSTLQAMHNIVILIKRELLLRQLCIDTSITDSCSLVLCTCKHTQMIWNAGEEKKQSSICKVHIRLTSQ